MKKIGTILIILIFLIMGVSIAKDVIIKKSIESIVSIATGGLKLNIRSLKVSIPRTFITIKGMVILNPDNFKDKIMLDIPHVYIDYDLSALLKKKIHLYDVQIDLKEFTIVKNINRETNLDYIKGSKKKTETKRKPSKSPDLQIDELNLKIGKLIYKDYSMPGEPSVSEYNINIDSRYKNIKNANQIIKLIVAKAVINTAIENLLDIREYDDIASDKLESGKDALKKTVNELKDIFKTKSPF